MTKRVMKGISGMMLMLVASVGANHVIAQCSADLIVNQNPGNCSTTVILEANVSDPIQSWTYSINGEIVSSDSFVFIDLTPGSYIAEVAVVTDQGCTAVSDSTFTVAGNPLEVNAGSDVVSCQAQTQLSASVNSTGPYSIHWYPEQYLDDPDSHNPTVMQNVDDQWFIVDVVDSISGCVNSDTIQVSQYGPIVESYSLCNGPVEIDMGPGADTYEWITYTDTAGNASAMNYPTTQQSITVTEPGNYLMIAHFQDCGSTTSQVVVEACTDCFNAFAAQPVQQDQCSETFEFLGTGTGTIISYEWDFGDGTTATGNFPIRTYTAGNYDVQLTTVDADGCVATSQQTLQVAGGHTVNTSSDTIGCQEEAYMEAFVTGGSGDFSYSWTPTQGTFSDPTQPVFHVEGVQDQVYYVQVTDNVSGCTAFDSVKVSSFVGYNETLELCNDSVLIDLGPGADLYNLAPLSFDPDQQSVWTDDTGSYVFYAEFPGCGAITSTFDVILCSTPNCSSEFISVENPQNCGLWVDFAGTNFSSPVDSVVWDFGDGQTFTDQGSGIFHQYDVGIYTATMTTYHSNGCISTFSENFSSTNGLNIELIADTVACNGTLPLSANITGGSGQYEYNWFPESLMSDPQSANPTISVSEETYVIVTVEDAVSGCTAYDTVWVFPNLETNEIISLCDDSVELTLDPGSMVYNWSFTDEFGNIAQLQTFENSVWVDEVGTYTCFTYYSGCAQVVHTFTVEECAPQNGEVWPGDANSDNIVTNADALYLGLAFNQTGPIRPAATLNWVGQPAPDWNFNFAQNNVNLKHADCDGNGIVNFDDTLAIDFNYLNTHNKFEAEPEGGNPPIWVEATPDTVGLEQGIDIVVHLGSAEQPVDSLHGVSFSLRFNESLLTETGLEIDFDNCVLGTAGSNVLVFQKRFFNDGAIDLAVTRNTLENFQGYGPIAHARIVTTDNLSGVHDLAIGVSNAFAMTATEAEVELTAIADTVVIDPNKVGIVAPVELEVAVYPNPTNGSVTVTGIENGNLTVMNAMGQMILRTDIRNAKQTVDLSRLPAGMYMLHFRTENGVATKRLRILK